MKPREMDCTYAEDHDLVPRYLAGELPEAEAEAFEAHYFGCERCWASVRQGGEIRAALGNAAIEPIPTDPAREFGSNAGMLLAAAAAVGVIALGVLQLSRRPEIDSFEPTYRGATAGALPLEVVSQPAGRIVLSWPEVDDAQLFVVEVFTSDGASVWRRETTSTTASLKPGELPPRPGISFLAKVEALDTMGQVVARSDLKPLSVP